MFYDFMRDNLQWVSSPRHNTVGPPPDLLSYTNTNLAMASELINTDSYVATVKRGRSCGYTTFIGLYSLWFALNNRNSTVCVTSVNNAQSNHVSGIVSQVIYHNFIHVDISSDMSCVLLPDCNSTLCFCSPGLLYNRFIGVHIDLLMVDELYKFSYVHNQHVARLLHKSARSFFVLDSSDYTKNGPWATEIRPNLNKPVIIL